jgi:hypothetical protein
MAVMEKDVGQGTGQAAQGAAAPGASIKPQPIFGLGKKECPAVCWSAFAPLATEEEAEWGL